MRTSPFDTAPSFLHGEGQSDAAIKDEVPARELAIGMLSGTDAGVGEIAAQLGYSGTKRLSPGLFGKWTGKSPAAFRRETADGGAGKQISGR